MIKKFILNPGKDTHTFLENININKEDKTNCDQLLGIFISI